MALPNENRVPRHHLISVPTYLSDQFSKTSAAEVCFPLQKFSSKLQAFLASYSLTVTSPYTLSDESYPILERSQEK